MRLDKYVNSGQLQHHKPSGSETTSLTKLIERDLHDCKTEDISVDRRFAIAYSAALNLCRLIIAAEGYRTRAREGHHALSLEIAGIILGQQTKTLITYFDACRKKRNKIDYDFCDVATMTELDELIETTRKFRDLVYEWLTSEHPEIV